MDGEVVAGETPRHLRREVERATHAISALHSQMRAIEEALSTQAAAIDDVAERAEKRARNISTILRTEREALQQATDMRDDGALAVSPASLGAIGATIATKAAVDTSAHASDITDFSLDETRIQAAAGADISEEILTEAPTFARDEDGIDDELRIDDAGFSDTDIDDAVIPEDTAAGVEALRARLAEAKANATWERPVLADAEASASDPLDPFDDIGARNDGNTDDKPPSTADSMTTAAAAVAGAGAVAAIAPRALEQEPEEFETLDLDTIAEGADAPLNLERRHAIDWAKFTRAANFPESEEDIETLDALYDVLTDPDAASLLQCAEDTLASLADIDLYMEDFRPPLVPVTAWRAHLDGSAGESIKGINAPVEQSRIRAKLNTDKGFEHLCTKFMDRYEKMGRRLITEADREQLIVDLSNTRTGRAYLMIADSAGRLSA
jgi:hypothetical protein